MLIECFNEQWQVDPYDFMYAFDICSKHLLDARPGLLTVVCSLAPLYNIRYLIRWTNRRKPIRCRGSTNSQNRVVLYLLHNIMQSSSSAPHSDSPDPEEDTLLEPLSQLDPDRRSVDIMAPPKTVRNERGMRDGIGLGLVLVRPPHLNVMYVG